MDQKRTREAARQLTEATRESYRTVVGRAFAARESNTRVTRSFFEDTVDELHDQTESNLRATQEFANKAKRQQEVLLELSCESLRPYQNFLDSLAGYHADSTDKEDS